MRSITKAVVVSVGLLMGAACTPSPQKVCEHAGQLESAARPDQSPESRARHMTECVTQMTAIQSAHATEYKTAANCIMAATDHTAMQPCIMPLLPYLQHP